MKNFSAALWAEVLKFRRSKLPFFTALGCSIVPLIGGLFMVILKDPEAAKSMGLISTKAQLLAGTADWPTFFGILTQAISVGGAIIFSIIAVWVFGREFSDRTAKELLALPTPREAIVSAKFVIIILWSLMLAAYIFIFGIVIGYLVVIPDWSVELLRSAMFDFFGSAVLVISMLSFVAFAASLGRGFMPPIGWLILTITLSQIAVITGWGDWFPWSVPALFSGMAGPRANLLGTHSYILVIITSLLGFIATYYWWRSADQAV